MSFVKGVANPEVEKYSGDIIYVDNRAAVTRSYTTERRHQDRTGILKNHATGN